MGSAAGGADEQSGVERAEGLGRSVLGHWRPIDFIVARLRLCRPLASHRIRPLRVFPATPTRRRAGFARVRDGKLAAIAQRRKIPLRWVREVSRMHRKKPTSTAFWQRRNALHTLIGKTFVTLPGRCTRGARRHAAIELNGGKPELAGAAVLLPEPSCVHAQPPRRAGGQDAQAVAEPIRPTCTGSNGWACSASGRPDQRCRWTR